MPFADKPKFNLFNDLQGLGVLSPYGHQTALHGVVLGTFIKPSYHFLIAEKGRCPDKLKKSGDPNDK
jgi:hypothetical protein